jgi:hypothetical protein
MHGCGADLGYDSKSKKGPAQHGVGGRRQMTTRLYIGNLSYDTVEDTLRDVFGGEGRAVRDVAIIKDRDSGRSRGFAFVEMETPEDAQRAVAELDGHEVDGRRIRVSEARDRPPRTGGPAGAGPRPGGGPRGGVGGKRFGAGGGGGGAPRRFEGEGGPAFEGGGPAFDGGGPAFDGGGGGGRRGGQRGGRRFDGAEGAGGGGGGRRDGGRRPARGGKRYEDDDDFE